MGCFEYRRTWCFLGTSWKWVGRESALSVHSFVFCRLATTLQTFFFFFFFLWLRCRFQWSTSLRQTQSTIRTKTRMIMRSGGNHWLSNCCAMQRRIKMDEARFMFSILQWMGKRHKKTRIHNVTPILIGIME